MSKKAFALFLFLITSLLVPALLGGCTGKDEKANESSKTSRQEKTSHLDNFPKDIAIYQPSEFYRFLGLEGERYIFETTDELSEVKAFYEEEFQKNDWPIERTYDDGGGMETLYVKYRGEETIQLALIPGEKVNSFYIHFSD